MSINSLLCLVPLGPGEAFGPAADNEERWVARWSGWPQQGSLEATAASHHSELTGWSGPGTQGRGVGCSGAKRSPAPSSQASLWGLSYPPPAKAPRALTFKHDGLPVAHLLLLSKELVAGCGTGHEHSEFLREDVQRDRVSSGEGTRDSEPCLPVVSGLPVLRGNTLLGEYFLPFLL